MKTICPLQQWNTIEWEGPPWSVVMLSLKWDNSSLEYQWECVFWALQMDALKRNLWGGTGVSFSKANPSFVHTGLGKERYYSGIVFTRALSVSFLIGWEWGKETMESLWASPLTGTSISGSGVTKKKTCPNCRKASEVAEPVIQPLPCLFSSDSELQSTGGTKCYFFGSISDQESRPKYCREGLCLGSAAGIILNIGRGRINLLMHQRQRTSISPW